MLVAMVLPDVDVYRLRSCARRRGQQTAPHEVDVYRSIGQIVCSSPWEFSQRTSIDYVVCSSPGERQPPSMWMSIDLTRARGAEIVCSSPRCSSDVDVYRLRACARRQV